MSKHQELILQGGGCLKKTKSNNDKLSAKKLDCQPVELTVLHSVFWKVYLGSLHVG